MKRQILISLILIIVTCSIRAQDLNSIGGSGFNIVTGYPAVNGP
ncbi:hypothetical protein [uncultured Acetobacteroides sp.]|nr:hypothetical protein [uncultured Acetobacteroides sp.]